MTLYENGGTYYYYISCTYLYCNNNNNNNLTNSKFDMILLKVYYSVYRHNACNHYKDVGRNWCINTIGQLYIMWCLKNMYLYLCVQKFTHQHRNLNVILSLKFQTASFTCITFIKVYYHLFIYIYIQPTYIFFVLFIFKTLHIINFISKNYQLHHCIYVFCMNVIYI